MWVCVTTVFYHVCPLCTDKKKQWLWRHWTKLCYFRAISLFNWQRFHFTLAHHTSLLATSVRWCRSIVVWTLIQDCCNPNYSLQDVKWHIVKMLLDNGTWNILAMFFKSSSRLRCNTMFVFCKLMHLSTGLYERKHRTTKQRVSKQLRIFITQKVAGRQAWQEDWLEQAKVQKTSQKVGWTGRQSKRRWAELVVRNKRLR